MTKKLTGKALAKFEAHRDVWKDVLHGVREIKGGGGKCTKVQAVEDFQQDLLKSVDQMHRGKAARKRKLDRKEGHYRSRI